MGVGAGWRGGWRTPRTAGHSPRWPQPSAPRFPWPSCWSTCRRCPPPWCSPGGRAGRWTTARSGWSWAGSCAGPQRARWAAAAPRLQPAAGPRRGPWAPSAPGWGSPPWRLLAGPAAEPEGICSPTGPPPAWRCARAPPRAAAPSAAGPRPAPSRRADRSSLCARPLAAPAEFGLYLPRKFAPAQLPLWPESSMCPKLLLSAGLTFRVSQKSLPSANYPHWL